MERTMALTVTMHREDGTYWARVEELPGCFAAGDTVEELIDALTEALSLALSTPESTVTATLGSVRILSG